MAYISEKKHKKIEGLIVFSLKTHTSFIFAKKALAGSKKSIGRKIKTHLLWKAFPYEPCYEHHVLYTTITTKHSSRMQTAHLPTVHASSKWTSLNMWPGGGPSTVRSKLNKEWLELGGGGVLYDGASVRGSWEGPCMGRPDALWVMITWTPPLLQTRLKHYLTATSLASGKYGSTNHRYWGGGVALSGDFNGCHLCND